MAIWLADMDLRLAEVEHYSGSNTCDKMRQLQVHQTLRLLKHNGDPYITMLHICLC